MTIARSPGDERANVAGWPWSHRKDFLERLAAQGYAPFTLHEYRKIAGRFCEAIEKRALHIGDLDGATVERLRHAVLSGGTGSARAYAKFCLGQFIDHLIEAGVATAPQPPAKKLTALERLREEYETYLRRQRGLAESTIDNCTGYMERFLAFRFELIGVELELPSLLALDLERRLNQNPPAAMRAHWPVLDVLAEMQDRMRP